MPIYGKFLGNLNGGYAAGDSYAVDLLSDTIKVALMGTGYTPNQDTHALWSDISANEVPATGGYTAGGLTLTNKTLTYNAVGKVTTFDADDAVWAASTIANARYAVVYKSTGTASTSVLIAYYDFGSSQSSNNGDFKIQWSASGIVTYTAS